jgi:hypothetical protein
VCLDVSKAEDVNKTNVNSWAALVIDRDMRKSVIQGNIANIGFYMEPLDVFCEKSTTNVGDGYKGVAVKGLRLSPMNVAFKKSTANGAPRYGVVSTKRSNVAKS